MRRLSSLLLASALSLSAGTALAACPDDTAGMDMNATAGTVENAGGNLIAKDGTRAPLQGADEPGAGGQAGDGNLIARDGSTMPLAGEHGGGDRFLATSEQDAEAQQHGERTAAATALDDDCEQ